MFSSPLLTFSVACASRSPALLTRRLHAASTSSRNLRTRSLTRQLTLYSNQPCHSTTQLHSCFIVTESATTDFLSPLMVPRIGPSGHMIFYLRNPVQVEYVADHFRESLNGPFGFDIEYRPNRIRGRGPNKTALIQLASDSVVLLIQVSAMSLFPHSIRKLLEDPAILKAGVGIKDDTIKLWNDFGISTAGCVDLSNLAHAVDSQWISHRQIGLANLVKTYEGRQMKKEKKIQMSNWELFLTDEQQEYAADDAIAGLSVFRKLQAMIPSVHPPPSETSFLFRISRGQAIASSGFPPFPPPVSKTPGTPATAMTPDATNLETSVTSVKSS